MSIVAAALVAQGRSLAVVWWRRGWTWSALAMSMHTWLGMRPIEELKQLRYNAQRWAELSLAADSEMTLTGNR